MFSRFTEKAIQAIMLAQEEAKRFHHGYVGTEHILLGILGEGDNVVIKTLQEMGFTAEQIKIAVEERLEFGTLTTDYGNIPFTHQAKQVLTYAWDEARKLGHNYVNVEHLFLSIFRESTNVAAKVLNELGVNVAKFKEILFTQLGNKVPPAHKAQPIVPTPTLDLYGRDLTWFAKEGKLDPVIGRDKEIERIIQILSRRTKNNPVLTGEAGVGKTAIVEGLAQRVEKEEVPEKLKNKRVISLDLGLVVAGTKYRGEFEDRIKKIMEEVRKSENVIMFIDELHTIIGTGGSEGSMDAANMFKPALARGELQCIGATTLDEYRKHIEGDAALERRFQSVLVEQPTQDETISILTGIRERYENFHQVKITDEAIAAAVNLSTRYITERFLPDKAIDVIDEAASKVMLRASGLPKELKEILKEKEGIVLEREIAEKKENAAELLAKLDEQEKALDLKIATFPPEYIRDSRKVVDEVVVADIVSNWTGIPLNTLNEEETARLIKIEDTLKDRIVGQDEAIKSLSRAVKRAKIGLKDPKRPMGSFLFLGPSGVGKSELAKQLAIFMFGKEDALIRIDMSEFMEKHTVSRLIGSPPGYVGYNEGGQLTEPIRRKPYSVVLFDELEKASPDIINILLQILEEGRLTDATGKAVDFKNTVIIMTSNVGSKFIEKKTSYGFHLSDDLQKADYDNMKEKLKDELKQEFKPEFLNRIDDIIIFKLLTKESLKSIVEIMVKDLQNRLKNQHIFISLDDAAKDFIAEKGHAAKQGARPLRRALQEYFEDRLADALLTQGLRSHIEVKATVTDNEITFTINQLSASEEKVLVLA